MMKNRLTDIETKLAFQEDAVQALSDLVYKQQQEIERLSAWCQRLASRLDSLGEPGSGDEKDEVPPHY